MLALRPNCECCDRDLPPNAPDAMICSYECTFCRDCVDNVLSNVCPNCGGGFAPRPVRPSQAWRSGTGLGNHPASARRVHAKHDRQEIARFAETIRHIDPLER